jgi:nucleoside-diphosphate-sugar epimerase
MNWKGKKVLVTGAGGFIGSHLVSRLLDEGADVRAMVRYNSANSPGQLAGIDASGGTLDILAGDIRDGRFVTGAVSGCEVVFHLAALIGIPYSYVAPSSYVDTNILGTLNVRRICWRRRGGVQHRYDGISGNYHRPKLRRSTRVDDLPFDWELRNQRRRQ